jgi:RNA recognition motif-containing protein
MPKSRYVLAIDGLSSSTRSKDIRYEAEACGPVLAVERDVKERLALVEFKHSADAADAYEKLEGLKVDGRTWKVSFATDKDLNFMGWPTDEFEGVGRTPSSRVGSPLRVDARD